MTLSSFSIVYWFISGSGVNLFLITPEKAIKLVGNDFFRHMLQTPSYVYAQHFCLVLRISIPTVLPKTHIHSKAYQNKRNLINSQCHYSFPNCIEEKEEQTPTHPHIRKCSEKSSHTQRERYGRAKNCGHKTPSLNKTLSAKE